MSKPLFFRRSSKFHNTTLHYTGKSCWHIATLSGVLMSWSNEGRCNVYT